MASAESQIAEDDFLCSICLSVFTKPASIPCGHNFCFDCITKCWDSKNPEFACPLCNETFSSRPMLRVNTIIAELIEKFKKTTLEKSSGTVEEKQAGEVLCSICSGAKLTALRSCLECVLSYCEKHLEPHQRIPTLKKHKLIHPVEDLESRLCDKHGKPLEMFCMTDQIFICEVCNGNCCRSHTIVTIEEAAQVVQTQFRSQMKHTEQMIEKRQQKIKEIENSLEASRNNAGMALTCSVNAMTAAVDYIKRSQAELTEIIETKQGKIENEAKGFIEELDLEIVQLKEKTTHLEESPGNDPFMYITNFRSLGIIQPQVKNWTLVTLKWTPFPAQGARLRATVMREVSMLCDPDFKEKQQHAVDVTLDPDTANPNLRLSADRKEVTHRKRNMNPPNDPKRFDLVFSVLGKERLCSIRCYYEVQVKDKTQWMLGVVNHSINRMEEPIPENGYWTICLRKGSEFTANANPAVNLPLRETLQKIGVFVDYKEGEVSFYDVDARVNIFSFTGCNFTEKLFPFFGPGPQDGGKNSAPLIITSVKHP
ncbi:E3 ubiquitin-protein ligase TRIM39-like [Paralichthys olivaceus]|uniref:E3 ubiquitin-protein ligase TRIM39-like n=1 Tax=Paralichthys olivaceus TaxID=8255 RepID=UPI00097D8421|nr:PREDICTED: zinc finger protein RFP-like [Paralichthys olivaceus]